MAKLESILAILGIDKMKLVQLKSKDIKGHTMKRRQACELMTLIVQNIALLMVEPEAQLKHPDNVSTECVGAIIEDMLKEMVPQMALVQQMAPQSYVI